ncbi:MAG: hypothetical protein KAR17_22850, partial [Cyclobacteriaceae bacterium]|nr:hypothetical protein [Cyclobacteriaceae bacterium]
NFSLLALENEDAINPGVLIKLQELAKQGGIIVGDKPKKIAEIRNLQLSQKDGGNLINQLWTNATDKKGKIFSGITPIEMLNDLNVSPDFNYSDKESFLLDYIHYKKDELDFYFIRNTSDVWISRECSFRQQNKVPEIWDPVSGEIIPVSIYNQNNEYINIPITLAPHGSQLIALRKTNPIPHYTQITVDGQHPPLFEFTKEGFLLLKDGIVELKKQDQSKTINNSVQSQTLVGGWELFFPENWGAPEKIDLPVLTFWTNSEIEGVKYFSGIATYKKTFQYDIQSNSSDNQRIYLDLGNLSKVGEVWLNGQHVGITWSLPYKFDVTNIIKSGDNNL